ncbi:hypothetical protein [Roseateles terrae]|uniref:RDD family membrane protein YckC n=1 Tax=Roseateles terrae TaxID=431060 RepID=A0ABR6GWJ9_9BURK|nr:hypothetical protein [Roseateles terrae]MBB3196449.1 putative RDD family membrane protein YckC [Roseateles terrae]OWQ83314.1 hypothetical protein CDN98_23030 [Roseateles terrae]
MDFQIFVNSCVLVYVMVRFADGMYGWARAWKLGLFAALVWAINAALMWERFGGTSAALKATYIAVGFVVGTLVMGALRNQQGTRNDTPPPR